MSKLVDNIREYQTGKRIAYKPTISTLSLEEEWSPRDLTLVSGSIYRLKVALGVDVIISDELLEHDPDAAVRMALEHVRHQVANHVFGEFRQPLLDLRTRFAQQSDYKGADMVADILDTMFKV